MRKMITVEGAHAAPVEVWLEFSLSSDGDDPIIEEDHVENPGGMQAIRYIRAPVKKDAADE